MDATIPIYEVILDDDSLGMTCVSFVDRPAIDVEFHAFRKQEEEGMIWMSSNEKREVVGPIAIPDQLILRLAEDGSYYYIRYSRKVIEQMAEKFLLNGFFANVSINHPTLDNPDMNYIDSFEKDVYLMRLWIIEDEKTDDANTKYNFSLPAGTLMAQYKVVSRKLWSMVKSGQVRGFSLEAFMGLQRADQTINSKENSIKMAKFDFDTKKLSLFRRFVMFLNEVSDEAQDISEIVKDDNAEAGEVTVKYWVNDDHYMQVDGEGYVRDEESNLVAEGKYLLQDGSYIVVDKNNKFVETLKGTDENIDNDELPSEAPIAEEKVKKEDEDEKNDEKTEGEDDGEDPEASDVPVPVDIEAPDEVPEAEPAATLVPYEIDGEEYLLPQPVVDYIKTLLGQNDEQMREVQMLRSRIPSAEPVPSVGNGEKKEKMDEFEGLSGIIRLMNGRK